MKPRKWHLWEPGQKTPYNFLLEIPYCGMQNEDDQYKVIREAEVGEVLLRHIGFDRVDVQREMVTHSRRFQRPTLVLNTFRITPYGRSSTGPQCFLLPPMEVMFDLRNLKHEDQSVAWTDSGEIYETRFGEEDYFLLVIPEVLREQDMLFTGMGVNQIPRRAIEFTPELAVQLDDWMQEFG